MAVVAKQVAVTATAAAVNTASAGGDFLTLSNAADGETAFLGASDVTTDTGFPLLAATTISLQLAGGEVLYAVAADTATLGFLST